jgi:hypothetical protein
MTDRSITFCNSRILPGQVYACSRSWLFLSTSVAFVLVVRRLRETFHCDWPSRLTGPFWQTIILGAKLVIAMVEHGAVTTLMAMGAYGRIFRAFSDVESTLRIAPNFFIRSCSDETQDSPMPGSGHADRRSRLPAASPLHTCHTGTRVQSGLPRPVSSSDPLRASDLSSRDCLGTEKASVRR